PTPSSTVCYSVIPPPPTSTLFPYTTLFRSSLIHPKPRRAPRAAGPSIVQPDVDLAVLDPHLVGLHRPDRGQAQRAPGPDVEPGAVPRALQLVTVQLARGEREVPVRAVVPERVDLAFRVDQTDPVPVGLHAEQRARRHIIQRCDANEPIRHGSLPELRLDRRPQLL